MSQTSLLSLAIEDPSAKIRTGPPVDDPEDHDLPSGRAFFRSS
jgi:hypothetical protein